MATSFLQLPLEVIQIVSEYLDLPDLRSLRYLGQHVNIGVTSSRRFRGFCTKKSVDFSGSKLRELAALLSTPGVQCNLEHLTLTGVLLITEGLRRIIREGTKPEDLQNPCGLKPTGMGVRYDPQRVAATSAEVADAVLQLHDFDLRIQEAIEEQRSGEDVASLGTLFEAIRSKCRAGKLKSLTLDVVIHREPTTRLPPAVGAPWRRVWRLAEQVFAASLQAWQASGIEIEALDVFSEVHNCGVQVYKIAELQGQFDFAKLNGLKALSLSSGNRILPLNEHDQLHQADRDREVVDEPYMAAYERDQERENTGEGQALRAERERLAEDPGNITGVADWLQHTPGLERLHLRDCVVANGRDNAFRNVAMRKALYKRIAEIAPLSHLRNLTLRGANIEMSSALKMLENSPHMKSLDMRDVRLTPTGGRGWEKLFDHLTSPDAELSYVYLNGLFEDTDTQHTYIVCFTPGTKPGYNISTGEDAKKRAARLELRHWNYRRPGPNGYNAFELTKREDVLRGIDFLRNSRYIMGSVQHHRWFAERKRLYWIR